MYRTIAKGNGYATGVVATRCVHAAEPVIVGFHAARTIWRNHRVKSREQCSAIRPTTTSRSDVLVDWHNVNTINELSTTDGRAISGPTADNRSSTKRQIAGRSCVFRERNRVARAHFGRNAAGKLSWASFKSLVADQSAERMSRFVHGEFGGVGRRLPMHCTAVGKALLAFSAVPQPVELPQLMPATITSIEALQSHLDQVRQQGCALDDEEHEPGVRCLAAPVYASTGFAVAALGLSGPTVRMTDQRVSELSTMLVAAARRFSEELSSNSGSSARYGSHVSSETSANSGV